MASRWTRDDEDEWQAEQAHAKHTEQNAPEPGDCDTCEKAYRAEHPASFGTCLCDTADAPAHEDYS